MKRISLWASGHKVAARGIIIAGHIILMGIAHFASRFAWPFDSSASRNILYGVLTILIVCCILYPEKISGSYDQKSEFQKSFFFRKSCDFLILLTSFISVCCVFSFNSSQDLTVLQASVIKDSTIYKYPTSERILSSMKEGKISKLPRSDRMILKKELKYQVGKLKRKSPHEENNGNAGMVLLIILTIIAALGLTFLLALLSCQISCGGAEGLAVFVMILGLAGIILLSVVIIRAIIRKKKVRKKSEVFPETNTKTKP